MIQPPGSASDGLQNRVCRVPGRHTTNHAPSATPRIDRKWLVLLAVGIGTFMSALDGSVVNTTLPVVRRAFGSDVATVEWVVTVYLLVVSGLLLSFGRLGDLRGHKIMYVSGFAVFVGSSALCGLAPSVEALIVFRALQALGAAMLFANGPAILTGNFPAAQRGQALGLQATMTYLGLTAGPALGGFLAGRLGWRSVFYINVPVGALALALSVRYIPRDRPEERTGRFDVVGALAFLLGLVTLLLALNQGHDWGWTSFPILGLALGAAAFVVAFVAIERRVASPMLDLGLFVSRVFSASTASAMLNYICLYSITFLMPFYLIQGRGLGPADAGLILTAQPLVMAVAAPLSGTLSDRIGSRLLSTAGMVILGIGLLLLAQLGSESPFGQAAAALTVVGLGTGIFISPNTSALMGAAPRNRQGIAAGVLATSRNVGMVLGVGLAGAIFTTVVARSPAGAGDPASLYTAVRMSFVVAAGVAFLGAVVAAARGS
jgi:EmrB/QacA subfamily drug resistance transporter